MNRGDYNIACHVYSCLFRFPFKLSPSPSPFTTTESLGALGVYYVFLLYTWPNKGTSRRVGTSDHLAYSQSINDCLSTKITVIYTYTQNFTNIFIYMQFPVCTNHIRNTEQIVSKFDNALLYFQQEKKLSQKQLFIFKSIKGEIIVHFHCQKKELTR